MASAGHVAPAGRTPAVAGHRARRTRPTSGQVPLSTLVGGAGAVHLALTPEHFGESLLFGVFFAAAAAFQRGDHAALWWSPAPLPEPERGARRG
ncbi:MAG: hypothetical protein ACRDHS_15540 [Actinomycetota bacterium]